MGLRCLCRCFMASFCLLVVLPSLLAEVPQFAEPVLTETELQVGTWVEANPELLSDPEGLTFRAKRLPPGLICDRETGTLSGYPTRPGTYKVEITATHEDKSKAVGKVTVSVDAFPAELAQGYQGLVDYVSSSFVPIGGMISLDVTMKGGLSGKLTLGNRPFPFKGVFKSQDGLVHESLIQVTKDMLLTIKTQESGSVTCELNGKLPEMKGSEESLEFFMEAHPYAYSRTQQATWAKGIYNIRLESRKPVDYAEEPVGNGYLIVNSHGAVRIKGKLADGTAITMSCMLLENEVTRKDFIIFVPLYPGKFGGSKIRQWIGMIHGGMSLMTEDEESVEASVGSHASLGLNWEKGESDVKSRYLYPEGLSIPLLPTGFPYIRPKGNELLLQAEPGYLNGNMAFLTSPLADFDCHFTLSKSGKTKAQTPWERPELVQIQLNISAATGLYQGSFVIPGTPRVKVLFSGLILTPRGGVSDQGFGYILYPVMPAELGQKIVFYSGPITIQSKIPEEPPARGGSNGPGLPGNPSGGLGGAGLGSHSGYDYEPLPDF